MHELRNERQLAKRNVLPRKKQHREEDAKESRPFWGGSSFNDGTTQTARDPLEGGPARTNLLLLNKESRPDPQLLFRTSKLLTHVV